MSFCRIFLAWLIMAAIPLQGIAASTMLFCAMESHHPHETQAKVAPHWQAHSATAGHDHAKHGHQKASDESASSSSMSDANHACGVCGACCHSTAIAEIPRWTAPQPPEQAREAEPFVLIDSPPSQVPDKPPRA